VREPLISPAPDGRRYQLARDMDFFGVAVPAGYCFDGASVPRFFWRIVSPYQPYVIRAACGHDYMYENAIWDKSTADDLFRQALEIDGAPRWLIPMMYRAVRLGGRGSYRKQ